MCQLTVKQELRDLKFAVSSLASLASLTGTPGSHERENARNIEFGIRSRLDWCLNVIDNEPELIGVPKVKTGGGSGSVINLR